MKCFTCDVQSVFWQRAALGFTSRQAEFTDSEKRVGSHFLHCAFADAPLWQCLSEVLGAFYFLFFIKGGRYIFEGETFKMKWRLKAFLHCFLCGLEKVLDVSASAFHLKNGDSFSCIKESLYEWIHCCPSAFRYYEGVHTRRRVYKWVLLSGN